MKVLITGATGFTGGILAQKLYKHGEDVRVVVRNKSKLRLTNVPYKEVIEADITDAKAVERAVKGVEEVFHIAALFRQAGIPDQAYWDVHVQGTQNLLDSSLKFGVKRFVHCSTVGVHGHIDDPPADENYRFSPGDIYQVTKLEGEKKAIQFHRETGLPVTVIRPCPIYGPGDLRLLKLFKLASLKITPILGRGDVFFHMVYVDDLVDALILASKKEAAIGEIFIAGGPEYLTLNEIVDLIAEITGRPNTKVHLPAKPFQILGFVCEKICIPLGIEPPIYRRRVDFFTKSRAFDISKARNLLNYQPKISLRDGLTNTVAWYKKNGLL
jgi:nucleoside-diphosphate-sugar epimerase